MPKTAEQAILKAACCVAGVDDEVHHLEAPILKKLAKRCDVTLKTLTGWLDQARSNTVFYNEQFAIVRAKPDEAVKIMFLVAMADGFITEDEKSVIRHLARKLGMDDLRFRKIHRAATKQMSGIELKLPKQQA